MILLRVRQPNMIIIQWFCSYPVKPNSHPDTCPHQTKRKYTMPRVEMASTPALFGFWPFALAITRVNVKSNQSTSMKNTPKATFSQSNYWAHRLVLMYACFQLTLGLCFKSSGQEWHFKPKDHLLGDVHPYFHDGECYLFYLKPGNFESALARSQDLLHWQEAQLSHNPIQPSDWFRPYYVLGVIRDSQSELFRSFHGFAQGRIVCSQSNDLLHWSCSPKGFSINPAEYYQRRRDPFVFWIPERHEYGCVMTTWMKNQPKETGGAISLATSSDLQNWTDHGAILFPGDIGEPECPQMFLLDGKWFLIASAYDNAVGKPVYWSSTSPLGPWNHSPDGSLDGKDLCAAQVAMNGNQPTLFGWIPAQPSRPGNQTWGGHLAIPREISMSQDGKLRVRPVTSIAQALSKLNWGNTFEGGNSFAAKLRVNRLKDNSPARIRFLPLGEVVISTIGIRICDSGGEIWSQCEMDSGLASDDMEVLILVDEDIVEVFVDDQYSLAARLPKSSPPQTLSIENASQLQVSRWTDTKPSFD